MKMPEISILMGTYNEKSRKTTALAIDSMLNQTFTDFEFMICDDGSEAEFFQWLQRYCRKDSRIILLHNEKNHGLAFSLNRCLRHASGIYVARMDADDIAKPERLEKQAAFLRQHEEYALVGCNAQLICGQCVWGERKMEERPQKDSFLNTSPFIHPAVMIRRNVLETHGGYCERREILRTEDYELFMRLYAKGCRGYNLQEALFIYREERWSYAKRKYRYRINECRVRLHGFRKLGILYGNLRYVMKPLAAGLVPSGFMIMLRRKRYGKADRTTPGM